MFYLFAIFGKLKDICLLSKKSSDITVIGVCILLNIFDTPLRAVVVYKKI